TKIVATIGPATSSPERIANLITAGVRVVRLNFSHGSQEDHRQVYDRVRSAAHDADTPIAILQDLQGPKLRVGTMSDPEGNSLETGATFRICTVEIVGTSERASTTFPDLARDVRVGDRVLLDDGNLELVVTSIEQDTEFGDEIVTRVIHGGHLKSNKGINLPGTQISSPALTEKDVEDLEFGINLGVDMIALSFVRSSADIVLAKDRIRVLGGTQPLIAKVEKPQAIDNLEDIVRAADGIMVARGDLGVELSVEAVPMIQKRLIRLANEMGKPVITATQMLESMIQNPRPTRAEASDIANAILDGTDAIMLSGETAIGEWPLEAVGVMKRIARRIESSEVLYVAPRATQHEVRTVQQSVAVAARELAQNLGAKAIAVLTASGVTAARVSQSRPGVPIIAFTDNQTVANRLALWYGVTPVVCDLTGSTDDIILRITSSLKSQGIGLPGDAIVIVGARPRQTQVQSVFLEVHLMS
ncbi:MAG: pyruvate kinase, partial [Thermomicrobiales bacterium]